MVKPSKPDEFIMHVMQKRKQANWEGNDKEAAKLFRQAKSMVKRGEVSDEELEALAYI